MGNHVLVVGRDKCICQKLKTVLNDGRIKIQYSESISDMDINFYRVHCNLIVIDMPAFETKSLEEIRAMNQPKTMPVLILHEGLSAKDKVLLYHIGASALLEKKVPMEICGAQIQALLRLYAAAENPSRSCPLIFDMGLVIDTSCRVVKTEDTVLDLTRKEFDLLLCLIQNSKRTLTFEQLYEEIWGEELDEHGLKTLKAHICTLRKKLPHSSKQSIQNVWGVGYRFISSHSETVS